MIFKKYPFYSTCIALLLFVSLPLYILSYEEEAMVSFAFVLLYLFIDKQLDFLFIIGKALKWTRMTIIWVGFFIVKNIFVLFFFLFLFLAKILDSKITLVVLASFYCIYSVLLARKMLTKEFVEHPRDSQGKLKD